MDRGDWPFALVGQHRLDITFQAGQLVLNDAPNDLQVDLEVLMNDHVPECHDVGPWHGGMFRLELRRQSTGCLADDPEEVNDPDLIPFVPIERFSAGGSRLFDACDRLADV